MFLPSPHYWSTYHLNHHPLYQFFTTAASSPPPTLHHFSTCHHHCLNSNSKLLAILMFKTIAEMVADSLTLCLQSNMPLGTSEAYWLFDHQNKCIVYFKSSWLLRCCRFICPLFGMIISLSLIYILQCNHAEQRSSCLILLFTRNGFFVGGCVVTKTWIHVWKLLLERL